MSGQFWRKGGPTEWARTVYTCGDCWLLALAIHRQIGAPIYVVDGGAHYVTRVSTSPDRYLDITGLQTRYGVLSYWDAITLTRGYDKLLVDMCVDADDGREEWEGGNRRAPEIARRLIEKYL